MKLIRKSMLLAMVLSLFVYLSVFGEEDKIVSVEMNTLEESFGVDAAGHHYVALKEAVKALAEEEALKSRQPKNRWGVSLSPAEFDLLARIVMLEAGGESPVGQQAVTEVILNRMVSPYYGGSLEYVLSARGQFSTWKMRYSSKAAHTPQVIASVNAVLEGQTNILPFHTLYFSRRAQNSRVQIRIGRHVFCNQ